MRPELRTQAPVTSPFGPVPEPGPAALPELERPDQRLRWTLRLLQAGAIVVVLIATTYNAFELDRFFVPKELTLHITALAALWLAAVSFRRSRFSWIDLLLVGYLLLSVISVVFATNIWLGIRALTISASAIAVFWCARALREADLHRPLLAALTIAVVLGAIASCLQAYGVRSDFFSLNRSPGGTLGNRNFVAHMVAFGLPLVLFSALRSTRRLPFILSSIGVSVVAVTLILTRSRAGWLAAGAALAVWLLAMLLSPALRQGTARRRFAGIVALMGIGVLAAVLIPNSLRWRSQNPYLDSMRGVANFQEGSGAGRLVQYRRSMVLAVRNPLLGAGPGNWSVEYPGVAVRRDPSLDGNEPGTTSNPWPSSDWVAFIAERGFIGALLLAVVFGMVCLRGLKQLLRSQLLDEALSAATLIAVAASALVAGLFDAVLLLALPALLVWTALGALLAVETSGPHFVSSRVRNVALVSVLLLSALGTLRSSAQLVGMGIYSAQRNRAALTTAALIDPGNYRVRIRLARLGNRAQRCKHALAARALLPSAQEARAASRGCSD
ncbi:MAG: O-antigen ligase family protein [Gemmatimonadota bacterium]